MAGDERRANPPAISRFWRPWGPRFLAATTAVYSVFLVYSTHYPRPDEILRRLMLAGPNGPSDKSLHFMAYGVLGLLAAATAWAYGRLHPQAAVRLVAALAAAAVIDEVTQPMFERFAEPLDWFCDVAGIQIGVLAILFLQWASLPRRSADGDAAQ